MEQNAFFWLLPQKNTSSVLLKKDQTLSFDFVQCFDGRFSYDVWIFAGPEADAHLGLSLDSQTVYAAMKIPASPEARWVQLGNLQAVKGEHRVTLTARDHDLQLGGFLICRDSSYIHNGLAEEHRKSILEGADVYALLEKAGLLGQKQETPEEKEQRLLLLDRYGFLERPDQDISENRCRCGVPMGGIGAGKIELDPEGVLTAITINNNCEVPIFKAPGSFFAAWAHSGAKKDAFLLQTADPGKTGFPLADSIDFEGRFPRASLTYSRENFPVKLCLTAFSSLVPYHEKDSSLPAAFYTFTLENTSADETEAALLFSFENLIGTGGSMVLESQNPEKEPSFIMNTWNPGFLWCDRRGNHQEAFSAPEGEGIFFAGTEDHGDPMSFGDYTLLCLSPENDVEITRNSGWDIFTGKKKFWEDFSADGRLTAPEVPAVGSDHIFPAAALSARLTLKPGEKRTLTFLLSWHMPCYPSASGEDMGVYYSRFFSTSREVAAYAAARKDRLFAETLAFEEALKASSLPDWLAEKLINDRFSIYSCSFFTRDGRFAINEAPSGMMGCLGTMDQRLASNVLYTDFYPWLDKKELTLFADIQGEDGSISHDLGFGEFISTPRPGTWSDLCSSFVLQVYKYYLYTKDRAFLDEMYPKIKRTVAYQLSIDLDKNGIPDVGSGHGTTYDTYHWYGTSAFVASLWISELAVCQKLAALYQDEAFEKDCRSWREKALASMDAELWNDHYDFGSYYNNYNDVSGKRKSENCFIAQLAGEWAAELLDTPDGLPREKTAQALTTIARQNVDINGIRLMNDETTPEGDFYGYGYTFLQYDEVYYGCLAIYHDQVEAGLRVFEKVYDCTFENQWNIGLTWFTDGRFCGLPYYMTNPASLFLLDALSGWLPDVASESLKLFPHTAKTVLSGNTLSLPLFSPEIWLHLDYEAEEKQVIYKIQVLRTPGAEKNGGTAPVFRTLILRADFPVKKLLINDTETTFTQEGNRVTVTGFSSSMEKGAEHRILLQ